MMIVILFFIFLILLQQTWTIHHKECLSEATYEYCKADKSKNNLFWNLYTGHNLYFKILLPGNCLSYGFIYSWTLKSLPTGRFIKDFHDFSSKAVLTIKKGILDCGEYDLKVAIKGTGKSRKILHCWFKINTAGPIPVISGGKHRNTFAGTNIVLDGTATEEAGLINLKYEWKCSSKISRPFCTNFVSTKKQTYINIDGNDDDIFNITLTISAGSIKQSARQEIQVVKKTSPLIEISCEKNCLSKGHIETDPTIYIFLKILCLENCDGISFEWSVSNDVSEDATRFGFSDSRLIINENELEFDSVYDVQVDAIKDGNPTETKTFWSFRTSPEPTTDCVLSPKEGVSMKTMFEIKCDGVRHKRPVSYSLDQLYKQPSTERVSGVFLSQNMIPRLSLLLAPETEVPDVVISIFDDRKISADQVESITVKPLLSHMQSEQLIKEILKIYNGQSGFISSVKALAKHGWTERAVQVINCLLSEMNHIKQENLKRDFAKKFKFKVLRDLLMFPPNRGIKGSITLVSKLIDTAIPKNVHYAVMLSKLCRSLSKSIQNFMTRTKYPMVEAHTASTYTSILVDCSDFLLDGKFEKRRGYNITTEVPIDVHKVVDEQYPNYEDIIDGRLREKYIDITNNAMDVLRHCTHAFSMSLACGEGIYHIGDITKLLMQLDSAENIERNFTSKPGVEIVLPNNLGFGDKENIRMLFNSFDNEIYFWDEKGKNISTRIVELSFYNERNEFVSEVPEHIDAYLDVITESSKVFTGGKTEVPSDSFEWKEKDISVYRINIKKHANLLVYIEDVKPEGIQVVLMQGKRPSLEDFKHAIVLKNKGRLEASVVDYDTWHYLAVLPLKTSTNRTITNLSASAFFQYVRNTFLSNESERKSVTYKYSFITQSCLEWRGGHWVSKNCKVGKGTTTKRIHCRCKSLSTIAGFTYSAESKIDNFTEIDYKIELVYNYHIFLTTAFILLCYFSAMCFTIFRSAYLTKQLFFLSDNLKNDRYAYFVIVKTGKGNGSGTSSNVVIKLHGKRSSSKAHVLNYPDPDRKLLQQRNEDWFILTTNSYLGELSQMELWYDAVGNRPTWYCEYVGICDLQAEKWWFFNVHSWFTVREQNKYYYEITVDESIKSRTKHEKRNFLKYFQFYFGADHSWNIFSSEEDLYITYLERIAVVLSHILLTYSFALLICVTPEMKIRDAFSKSFFASYVRILGYAVAVSMMSFGINTIFVFCFRNSQRKFVSTGKKSLLPNYAIKLTWIFLIAFILLEILYLSAFGFWASDMACRAWFMVTTIALIISIFVWENLYISLYNLFEKQFSKDISSESMYDYKAIIFEAEQQRQELYQNIGVYGLRPYLTHLYKPLSEEEFEIKKQSKLQKISLSKTLRDMLLFILYLICLYVLAYENTDHMSALHNIHMSDMLEAETSETPLGDVESLPDIYTYINETFIPTAHAYNWYGNWNVLDPGLMTDFGTKVLGVVRIRQKRVRENSCSLNHFARKLNITHCNPEFSIETVDTKSYGGKMSMWTYHFSLDTGITITYGMLGSYSGGGYITILGRNINNAYYMVDLLQKYQWIDFLTRALFIEFWTYNANSNLFNAVKIVFETSATYFVTASTEIYTSRLMHVDIKAEMVPVIGFSVFIIIVGYQVFNCLNTIIQQKLSFFKRFWNFMDLIIIIMNVTLIALSIYKIELMNDLLEKLKSTKKTEFINYYVVVYYDKSLTLLLAFLICIAILRTWKYIRFGVMFRVFERTLIMQIAPITGVLVYNIITLCMFSLLGYVMFAGFSQNFRNLKVTFTCMLLRSLNFNAGDFDFKILEQYLPNGSFLFYTGYGLVMLLIMNIYITVIIMYYEKSLDYYAEEKLQYSVKDYARDEFKYFTKYLARYVKRLRLKAGEDLAQKITPKTHRYADSLVINEKKVKEMSLVAMGTAYNFLLRKDTRTLNAIDVRVMANIIYFTMNKPAGKMKHVFFKCDHEGNAKLIPDSRLLEMEEVLRKLLKQETKQKKKEKSSLKDVVSLKRLENIHKILTTTNRVLRNINIVSSGRK